MKRFTSLAFMGALGLAGTLPAVAGNIPQYKPVFECTQGEESTFPYLQNPTKVPSTFSQHSLIFADNKEYNLRANTGKGFPIGFEFTYGGQKFTQFAIDTWGAIFLGTEGDGVVYRGQNTMIFNENLPHERNKADEFYIGMIMSDVYPDFKGADKEKHQAEIGYGLIGEEGDRVLVVEFLNYAPKNEKQSKAAYYDLQIRLYEKDNHVEIAFNERITPMVDYRFTLGMRGFEIEDAILLDAPSINAEPTVSKYKVTDMTRGGSHIVWAGGTTDPNLVDKNFKPVYGFYPESDKTAPSNAPANLKVEQNGAEAIVSCDRAEGSPATVLLYSEKPFTDSDYPKDGETFRSQGKFGEFETLIGDATVLYYGDAEHIELTIPEIKDSQDYYIMALSANGYPAFGISNPASAVLSTSQAAPSELNARADGKTIRLGWKAEDPVIVAVTDECSTIAERYYEGIFGRPSADVNVGDEIEGGGRVIYVGDASEFNWVDAPDNGMNYFAAWTVKDGRVSATAALSHAETAAALPYMPGFEKYPSLVVPENLDANTVDGMTLGTVTRLHSGDRALRVRLIADKPIEFYLPELDLSDGAQLTFEYALETDRGFEENGNVQIPLGYKPGEFGSGALEIKVRNNGDIKTVKSIKEYAGEMESNGDGGYITGSSTYDSHTVDLGAHQGQTAVGFRAMTQGFSFMYLRGIRIDRLTGVESVDLTKLSIVRGGNGEVSVVLAEDGDVKVYSVDGRTVADVNAKAGEETAIALPAGLYIVNGVKIAVR